MSSDGLKKLFEKHLAGGKGTRLLIIVGFIGILLIFLSSVIPAGKTDKNQENTYAEYSSDEYAAMLENRLSSIVSEITGSERVSVMVTIESGVEHVYANQLKQSADLTEDDTGGGSLKKKNDTTEESYIMVEDENGNKTALLLTSLSPTVKGVVIVCDGCNDTAVAEKVKGSVKTVLNISGSRVSVVGRN